MRHDEPEAEVNESILPDLLSALLEQWDGEVAEPTSLAAPDILAEPVNANAGDAAPPQFEARLRQTQWWQIPATGDPSIPASDFGFDGLLSQLNKQQDAPDSNGDHPPEGSSQLPALEDSPIDPSMEPSAFGSDQFESACPIVLDTPDEPKAFQVTEPAFDELDSLLALLNAQYDEFTAVDKQSAEATPDLPQRPEAAIEAVPASPSTSCQQEELHSLAQQHETPSVQQEFVETLAPQAVPAHQAVAHTHTSSTAKLRYIQFSMAEDSFAIPIGQVIESGRLTDVAPLPCVNEAIRGLINLHGEIVPLLDLRSLLGNIHGDCPPDEKMLIVRTRNSEGVCGLAVDRVAGILALDTHELQNLNPSTTDLAGTFVNGFCERQGSLVRLLDLERLFDNLSGKVAPATESIQDQPGRS